MPRPHRSQMPFPVRNPRGFGRFFRLRPTKGACLPGMATAGIFQMAASSVRFFGMGDLPWVEGRLRNQISQMIWRSSSSYQILGRYLFAQDRPKLFDELFMFG